MKHSSIKDIEVQRKINSSLKTSENERTAMAKRIDTLNAALKSIVEHRDIEKRAIEANIIAKFKKSISSHIKKMATVPYSSNCKDCYRCIQQVLVSIQNEIGIPYTEVLHELNPNEMRIADLIREGKCTKEIAEILNLAPSSVSWYRNQIRNKLGLINAKTSLRSFLSKYDRDTSLFK